MANVRKPLRRINQNVPGDLYSGPQKVDHSGHVHLLRLFPSQHSVNPGPMDLARGPVIE